MATERDIDLDTVLSRGFDAGNYCNAYETQDYETGLAKRTAKPRAGVRRELQQAWQVAFTLGFFGSYELHEMGEHEDAYTEALASPHGQRCVELGYVDRTEDDANPCDCGSCHDHNADDAG